LNGDSWGGSIYFGAVIEAAIANLTSHEARALRWLRSSTIVGSMNVMIDGGIHRAPTCHDMALVGASLLSEIRPDRLVPARSAVASHPG